jgi:hypothetical protein
VTIQWSSTIRILLSRKMKNVILKILKFGRNNEAEILGTFYRIKP